MNTVSGEKSLPGRHGGVWSRVLCAAIAVIFALSLVAAFPPQRAAAQEFYTGGSLPEVGKKINELIYPTIGYPQILPRGSEFTIEWDWRKSDPSAAMPDFEDVDGVSDWKVWVTTTVAANVQNYWGFTDDPDDWYNFGGPAWDRYGYGTYEDPVHTVVNTRHLKVKSVRRGPSERWPEIFGQTGFVVDKITVEVPRSVPLDLYDVHVQCVSGDVGGEFRIKDRQPHALNVIKAYKGDIKIVQISDTHVYGQELKNGFNLDYNTYELREPRPGTPDRHTDTLFPVPGWDEFPLDKDGDGRANEGAIYLQETIQAINLINPDFVVFTGDSVNAQSNFNTYPKDTSYWGDKTGDMGTEYRFEYTWWYDELLALDVPIFTVPGNHDGYCWDGHAVEHDDGLEIWQDLFGPVYYSWDYGDQRYIAVNDMDWPKVDPDGPVPFNNPGNIIFAIIKSAFPEFGKNYQDRNGFLVDLSVLALPIKVIAPHKWHGQVRGNGDRWNPPRTPPSSYPLWNPGDPLTYTGQLAWIRNELAGAQAAGKKLKGVFIHHDPLKLLLKPPEMWANPDMLGMFTASGGEGEGSQALVQLMRKYAVDFIASGHAHSDYVAQVDWAPVGPSPGKLTSINTSAAVVPVDGVSSLTPRTAEKYGGFRLLTINNNRLAGWGFPGAEGDPLSKYSIPGWEGLQVGAGADNSYSLYRSNRPVLQWMEQDQAADRPPVSPGDPGTFSAALPLDKTGQYTDVTCRARNTLNQAGAVLNLTGCRIEFPMKKMSGGEYYVAENGTILEQYDTDGGRHMVVVTADLPGGGTVPVRVRIGGVDKAPPVVDAFTVDGGAARTGDLDVKVAFQAHDALSGVKDYMISNNENFKNAEWVPYDAGRVELDWRLTGAAGLYSKKTVYLKFRDHAMPSNVTDVQKASIAYDPDGPPTGSVVINGGDDSTDKDLVELTLKARDAGGVEGMRIANSEDDLEDASWRAFKDKAYWTIEPDEQNVATVYVQYRDTAGLESAVYSDSIVFEPGGETAGVGVSDFYFAEGTCRPGFDPYICIQNPNEENATVQIHYMLGNGENATGYAVVKAHSRSTVNVKDTLGEADDAAHDFSCRVESTNGVGIVAERPMYFNYRGEWTGGHDVMGATAPAKTFYFAEGTCRPGFDPYICIQNPNDADTRVKITYMLGNGETVEDTVRVAARSRHTVVVKEKLGEGDDAAHDFSAKVESIGGKKIVAERPMYFNYRGQWTGGHDVMGATAPAKTFYFAEGTCRPGFDPYICIQNPNDADTEVKITYMLGDGRVVEDTVPVRRRSRSTVVVKDKLGEGDDAAHDFSAKVESTSDALIIAERPMYFNYRGEWTGGHNVMGATAPAKTFYFAEGTCRPGFDPYICIQNPGDDDADVKITYMLGDGRVVEDTVPVRRRSRSTVVVKDKLGEGDDAAHDFSAKVESTSDALIIAERPMYFNYRGEWTGGHDVVGMGE